VVLFLCALLSKSAALPFAGVVVVISLALGQDDPPHGVRHRLRRAFVLALPFLLVAGVALALYLTVGAEARVLASGGSEGRPTGPLTPFLVMAGLVRIALFPVHLRLIYDLTLPGPQLALSVVLGVATLLAAAWGCAELFRRRSPGWFAWIWFVLFSGIFLQVVPFNTWSLVSERFLFLPLGGLALLVAAGSVRLPRRVAVPTVVVLTGLLLLSTADRSRDWSSAYRLVAANASLSPARSLSAELLIDEAVKVGSFQEALSAARRVTPASRAEVLSAYVQARAAIHAGDISAARRLADQALDAAGVEVSSFGLQLANLALETGRAGAAVDLYQAWLLERPGGAAIHYNLGLSLKQAGRAEEAAAAIRSAIDAGLRQGAAYNHLGLALRDLNRPREAEAAFRAGLAADPLEWQAAYNLARLFIGEGRTGEAESQLELARTRALSVGADAAPVDALLRAISG
jgi:Tfp pilus assembly protein PilF